MRLAVIALVAGAFLAGCTTPKVQGGNELGGMIRYGNRYSGDEAFQQAQAECARYGKIARVTHQDESFVWTLYYDCVDRPS